MNKCGRRQTAREVREKEDETRRWESPGYELLHNGAASDIPTLEASDGEIIAWVRTSAEYKFFLNVCFETEQSFTIFVQLMLGKDLSSVPTYLSTKEGMVSHGLFHQRLFRIWVQTDCASFAVSISIPSTLSAVPWTAKRENGDSWYGQNGHYDGVRSWSSGPRIRFTLPRKEVYVGEELYVALNDCENDKS
jgi:hypothetical protein